MGFVEEVAERLHHGWADAVDHGEFGERVGILFARLDRGFAEARQGAEAFHQVAGGDGADVADAEAEQEAGGVGPALGLDRGEQGVDRLGLPAFAADQFVAVGAKAEDVGGFVEPAQSHEFGDGLFAQPFDVERGAGGEMAQALEALGGADQAAGAADVDLAFLGDCLAAALRGNGRGRRRRGRSSSRVSTSTICGMTSPARCRTTRSPMRAPRRAISSRLCRVALVTTTPPTVTGSSRATGVSLPVRPTWMSIASRVVWARSAGNLWGERPARRLADRSKAALPVEAIDLVDDAVDVEGKIGALGLDRAVVGEQAVDVGEAAEIVGDWEAPGADLFGDFGLGVAGDGGRFAPAVGEEAQRTRFRDGRVLLAQRAGGGVAGVGELAGFGGVFGFGEHSGVERGEILLRHVHFATDFEDIGHLPSLCSRGSGGPGWVPGFAGTQVGRDVGDRADIGGYILACRPVAAGRGQYQHALLVAERTGQAIDLGFGGERHFGVGAEAEEAADAGDEIAHFIVGEGVVEAEHRHRVRHLGERAVRGGADLAARAVGADQ